MDVDGMLPPLSWSFLSIVRLSLIEIGELLAKTSKKTKTDLKVNELQFDGNMVDGIHQTDIVEFQRYEKGIIKKKKCSSIVHL